MLHVQQLLGTKKVIYRAALRSLMSRPLRPTKKVHPRKHNPLKWALLAFFVLAAVVITFLKFSQSRIASAASTPPLSASPAVVPPPPEPTAMTASTGLTFIPTIPKKAMPLGKSEPGMAWIPGGEFSMGAQDPPDMEHDHVGMKATEDSRPVHRVYVDGFWMDKTDVTNAKFAKFVASTHYIT